MTKCPNCGAPLGISITLETDYSGTKRILEAATGTASFTNEQLSSLKWKQSIKRDALSTLLVTSDLLNVPLAKLLYDTLNTSANKSWKLAEMMYKLSSNDEGTQWIQRWTPLKLT